MVSVWFAYLDLPVSFFVAVGATNFCSITNLEADLHESWFKGIFSTHSELLLWESFKLECFNKRIQFWGITLHRPLYVKKLVWT